VVENDDGGGDAAQAFEGDELALWRGVHVGVTSGGKGGNANYGGIANG
jgi:hypothetical protein